MNGRDPSERAQALLARIRERIDELGELHAEVNAHWVHEDGVSALAALAPEHEMNALALAYADLDSKWPHVPPTNDRPGHGLG